MTLPPRRRCAPWAFACLLAVVPTVVARAEIKLGDLREGETFEGRIQLREAQRVVRASDGGLLLGREARLEAGVLWRVTAADKAEVALAGKLAEGSYTLEEASLGAPPATFRLDLAGLVLGLKLRRGGAAAAEAAGASWKAVSARFEEEMRARRVPARVVGAIVERARGDVEAALAVPFTFVLLDRRLEPPFRLQVPLRSPEGRPAGVVALEPVARALTASPDARTLEVPLRGTLTVKGQPSRSLLLTLKRPLAGLGGAREPRTRTMDLGETGWLRWSPQPDGRPRAWLALQSIAEYREAEELGTVDALLPPYRQEHILELTHAPREAKAPRFRPPGQVLPPLRGILEDLRREEPALAEKIAALERAPDRVREALAEYALLVEKGEKSERARALFDAALAETLALLAFRDDHAVVRDALDTALRGETRLTIVLAALRAAAHPGAILSDEERVARFVEAARRREAELAVWGARFLAEAPWKGAAEALAEVARRSPLAEELERSLPFDAARLLGPERSGGDWRKGLEDLARLPPDSISYAFPLTVVRPPGQEPPGPLASAIKALPVRRLAVVIDCSPAMAAPLPPAARLVEGEQIGAQLALRDLSRFAWARGEVEAILKALPDGGAFAIIAPQKEAVSWRGELAAVSPENLRAAAAHLRGLKLAEENRLERALGPLFDYEGVEAAVVIVAGEFDPRREVGFALRNYRRGIRVIACGFAPPRPEEPSALERLGRRNFGWYHFIGAR